MTRARTLNRGKRPTSSRRPYTAIPVRRYQWAGSGLLANFRWKVMVLILLGAVLGPILAFSLLSPVRDWALGALGYGLIPVTIWLACFALVFRYKSAWVKRLWRVWLGSALGVAVSLGILSLFHASGGVMKEASLGGYWGQYLGGTPIPLGALKVAVLMLLGPLMLFPRRSAPIYGRVSARLPLACAFSLRWTWKRLMRLAVTLPNSISFRRQGRPSEGVLTGNASISPRRSLRAVLGVSARESGAAEVPPPEPTPEGPEASEIRHNKVMNKKHGWQLPSPELLSKEESRPVPQAVLQEMSRHIEDTLAEHRVEVAVEDIRMGPRVIRFGLVPGWTKRYRESKGARSKAQGSLEAEMSRVKVQSILVREKDMALALKTPYLRLEAPVPGEALVGLEVPNPYPRSVPLRSVAEAAAFEKIAARGGLPVALGEDTGGEPVVSDLSDLPHLLIAGATGSGKSVCINSIVASLLLTVRPDRLRMLMVDPKRVELTPFNGIPHLLSPVIVDTDEMLVVLKAVQNEMLRRYKLMEGVGVRNIDGYNKKAKDNMPFLVIVIDELADLMMASGYEAEQALVRLAQLGRATGIHLILATQRPSVNVVTGLLKANIPARVAFAVASQVDSRVILDSVGAEKLLGKGDMLLLTSDSPKPKRVQGTFVHDREIAKLVEFWQLQSGPPLPDIPLDERTEADAGEDYGDDDDLLLRARELAERYPHVSPSLLQRRLQIGYSKARRLVELLEEEGLIAGSTRLPV